MYLTDYRSADARMQALRTALDLWYVARAEPEADVDRTDAAAAAFACLGPGTILGPLGPAVVTAVEMLRPPACTDEAWRELRAATGIVLRALLLDLGDPTDG